MVDNFTVKNLVDVYSEMADSEAKSYIGKALILCVTDWVQRGIANMTDSEISLAKNQGKIAAIKAYRERTGKELKDSKDAVEADAKRLGFEFYTGSW